MVATIVKNGRSFVCIKRAENLEAKVGDNRNQFFGTLKFSFHLFKKN